ncbi:hypothetical protein ACMFMG_006295 [Clarireedia jacksonii]
MAPQIPPSQGHHNRRRMSTRADTAIEESKLQEAQQSAEGTYPQTAKARKRRRLSEDDTSKGRPKKCSRTSTPRKQVAKQTRRKRSADPLSESNLRLWDEVDRAANSHGPASTKRSLSSRYSITSDSETSRSQRSSGSFAVYRFTHLKKARVYIHVKLPENIQDTVDAIINADPSDERRKYLKVVSQNFSDGCTEAARAAVGEDDFIHHFTTLLQAIQPSSLCFREKADWQEDLKPKIAQSDFNLDFLASPTPQDDPEQGILSRASDILAPPPSKRLAYTSPKSSKPKETQEADMMPPPPFPTTSPIKTPRPDLSIGTKVDALISALSSPDLSRIQADEFLQQLQNQMIARAPRMLVEPALIAVPALRASDLAFPFAVIEGKAYSTGRQIFEAENQAAVSGACGLKIQLCLDELVERATARSNSQLAPAENPFPLFFSICTEGPIHELWVHWTNVEDGVRKFNMTLLKLCHGVLLEGVE